MLHRGVVVAAIVWWDRARRNRLAGREDLLRPANSSSTDPNYPQSNPVSHHNDSTCIDSVIVAISLHRFDYTTLTVSTPPETRTCRMTVLSNLLAGCDVEPAGRTCVSPQETPCSGQGRLGGRAVSHALRASSPFVRILPRWAAACRVLGGGVKPRITLVQPE